MATVCSGFELFGASAATFMMEAILAQRIAHDQISPVAAPFAAQRPEIPVCRVRRRRWRLLPALMPGKARAAMPFDGYWTVSIVTQSGSCDRTLVLPVSIVDGRLDGANGALLGTVNSQGRRQRPDGRRRPPRHGERPAGRQRRLGPLERQRHRRVLQRPLDRAARLKPAIGQSAGIAVEDGR